MELPVYNQKKEIVDKVVLKDQYFDILFNNDTVFQVYTSLLSNRRQPLAHTKDRSEVSGGGRKPWSQKGTGRARAGSTRSPIWRHGGVTFGPRQNEENFQKKINRKAKTKALEMILSQKIKDNEFYYVKNEEQNLDFYISFQGAFSSDTIEEIRTPKYKGKMFVFLDKALTDNDKINLSTFVRLKVI